MRRPGFALSWPHMIRLLFVAAGAVSVGLGVAGILLPMVPATPFLLLATFFFARSSPRFHRWLVEHPWLGAYIANYRSGKPLTRRQLMTILLTLWISFAISFAIVDLVPLRILFVAIPVGVTVYLLYWNRQRIATATDLPDASL
jgi:uncharacterized membrane protein YbaN (DUF454 family)